MADVPKGYLRYKLAIWRPGKMSALPLFFNQHVIFYVVWKNEQPLPSPPPSSPLPPSQEDYMNSRFSSCVHNTQFPLNERILKRASVLLWLSPFFILWFGCEMQNQIKQLKKRIICRQSCRFSAGNWRSCEREKNDCSLYKIGWVNIIWHLLSLFNIRL